MKLYYSPGACSLAPHIVLTELGLAHRIDKVSLRGHTTSDGSDFRAINPKGQVPALVLDDGSVMTEVAVLLQYLADQKPGSGLAPPAGTMARWRLMETLNYIATDIHKGLGGFFNPVLSDEIKVPLRAQMAKKLDALAARFDTRHYADGESYSIADAYLFTVLGWAPMVGIDLATWPQLVAYRARIEERPAVQRALIAEGLRTA